MGSGALLALYGSVWLVARVTTWTLALQLVALAGLVATPIALGYLMRTLVEMVAGVCSSCPYLQPQPDVRLGHYRLGIPSSSAWRRPSNG